MIYFILYAPVSDIFYFSLNIKPFTVFYRKFDIIVLNFLTNVAFLKKIIKGISAN